MITFFNKCFNLKRKRETKRKTRMQMARVSALPKDYQYVYKKIREQMWRFVGSNGYDVLEAQYELIDLFERGAAEGKRALDITGDDVAEFVEKLLKKTKTHKDDWKKQLNKDIQKKLGRKYRRRHK